MAFPLQQILVGKLNSRKSIRLPHFHFADDLSVFDPCPIPLAPTTFEDLLQLIPPRWTISKHRFIVADKPFEIRIGRNRTHVVFLSFCVPDGRTMFWSCVQTVESLTTQRAVWLHWQRFLEDPESYLTRKYTGRLQKYIGNSAAA